MALPLYLAMTAAEMIRSDKMPEHSAYMACHFSPYGTGLSNFPEQLPADCMIVLNDRTPVQGHDPQLIAAQLRQIAEEFHASAVLLDLQRAGNEETAVIAKAVVDMLSCPAGVSELYAGDLACPVFVSPPPLHCSLKDHIAPWQGRELWLEAALEAETITVTEKGSCYAPLFPAEAIAPCHEDTHLHCRYHIEVSENKASFTLFRTADDLGGLLQEAETMGITRAIGLYQELKSL